MPLTGHNSDLFSGCVHLMKKLVVLAIMGFSSGAFAEDLKPELYVKHINFSCEPYFAGGASKGVCTETLEVSLQGVPKDVKTAEIVCDVVWRYWPRYKTETQIKEVAQTVLMPMQYGSGRVLADLKADLGSLTEPTDRVQPASNTCHATWRPGH